MAANCPHDEPQGVCKPLEKSLKGGLRGMEHSGRFHRAATIVLGLATHATWNPGNCLKPQEQVSALFTLYDI